MRNNLRESLDLTKWATTSECDAVARFSCVSGNQLLVGKFQMNRMGVTGIVQMRIRVTSDFPAWKYL